MIARERLPNRRTGITDNLHWSFEGRDAGRRIHVTANLAPRGAVLETFLRGGGQVGSERDFLLDDIAVLVSRDLQHGDTIAALAAGVGRLPDGRPSSVIGAILDKLLALERHIAACGRAEAAK